MKAMKIKLYHYLLNLDKLKILRLSIGVIYFWFGSLKFFGGLSPAETLASDTLRILTLQMIPENVSYILLAFGETLMGAFLIFNIWPRITILLAMAHMCCTFTPLVLLPDVSFNEMPYSVTLTGQYIMKNMVIMSALLVLYPFKKVASDKTRLALISRRSRHNVLIQNIKNRYRKPIAYSKRNHVIIRSKIN